MIITRKALNPLVVGVDCSTSAIKAQLWDDQGRVVSSGFAPLSLITPQPTWHEQSAESWWTAFCVAAGQAASQVDANRLKAICIVNQRETFVSVDKEGTPISNAILWMDERARDLLPELERSFGSQDFQQQTGKHLSVNLTAVKIAWLKHNQPDIFARVYKYLDVHAYFVFRLTGSYATAWGCADPTGLFDTYAKCWAGGILDQIGIKPEQLPDVYPPGTIMGTITPTAARECGLPAGLPVVAGLGDGQACGLGVDTSVPGDAYLSLGTSVISGTYSEEYTINPAFRTMSGGLVDSYMLETVLLGGGYTLSWFMEKIAANPGKEVAQLQDFYDQAGSEIPPGSDGLVVIPYWNSVLGPYWDPAASGIIVGWRGFHNLQHLYRAILEGVAFEQKLYMLDTEKALGRSINRFIAIGGGAKSALWCQIIADITGKPIFRSETTEAAALGAGILAAGASGLHIDARQAARAMSRLLPRPFEPDPSRHDFYTHMFDKVYRPIFPALQPYLKSLSLIAEKQESGG